MHLLLLADMAASARADDVVAQVDDDRLSAADLLSAAWTGARSIAGVDALVYIGTNGLAVPVALFASAAADVPFVPLNYRLSDDQLHELIAPLGDVGVVAEGDVVGRLADRGHRVLDVEAFLAAARATPGSGEVPSEAEAPAVLLYTSGTSAAPKRAVLRHRHLTSYVIGTVEFGGGNPDEAALVSVPPYHVAGLAALMSNLYLGRRIVYLHQFDAAAWVATVRAQQITHAMVVPTMLGRICDELERDGRGLPSLRAMSYGGARAHGVLLERTMAAMPDVELTNAYGLTETSSTIALLGPEDHRAAKDGDPVARSRLSSVGRVLPTVEVQVRGLEGESLPSGEVGEIWVRGEQVSGEYANGPAVDPEGWFATRDRGRIDEDGYLFIEGRADDTIIRGGENIAPAEIEEVLLRHPEIAECAVVGIEDAEWGQRIVAVVVPRDRAAPDPASVQSYVRGSLRSSKTPDLVTFVGALPYTETGKLVRRQVQADVEALLASSERA